MVEGTGIILTNLIIIVVADIFMTKAVFTMRRDLLLWMVAYYVHTIGRVFALVHNLLPEMNIYELNVIFSGIAVLIFIFSSVRDYMDIYDIKLKNIKSKNKLKGLNLSICYFSIFTLSLNIGFDEFVRFFISIIVELITILLLILAIWSLFKISQKKQSPTYKFFMYVLIIGLFDIIFTALSDFDVVYAHEIMLSLDLILNLFLLIVPIIISMEREILVQEAHLQEEQIHNQKLESLGLLAGGIAHDFNNYLTSILGNTSLLKLDIPESNENYEIVAEIENAANRASELTRRLLTFSKGEALQKSVNDTEKLIRESTSFTLRGSSVLAKYEISPSLWPVYVDAGQISQVLQNIVLNAIQAVDKGSVIEILAENSVISSNNSLGLKAGEFVKISIRDQGAGIPPQNLQKIFDPYFTTKSTGTGLGLSVCYSIIKKHEGTITVESEVHKGTTFSFYLRRYNDPNQQK
ncbi:sensor histidine kinase [Candidatus Lokiarchaeum ossiferum]|uniref:sensor histidine kinase n=1 Tax=Candidatus Lokiarchaeum ossiferum TaxID=2951803 RepID=UPI00352C618C